MIFREVSLKGVFEIEPEIRNDDRGYFYRFFCKKEFAQIGIDMQWVQFNHSFTKQAGSIRGMHFQLPPFAETKLVRCISGKVYDVVVDLRQNSTTYLQWFGTELSAENRKMLFIPEGFAHGFQTLTDDCELIYHHSEYHVHEAEGGIKYNDPKVNIKWPLSVTLISERDSNHSLLDNAFKEQKFNG